MNDAPLRLTGLFVHPVKSTAVRPLTEADVLHRGLVDDRSWLVVDEYGEMVTARTLRPLLRVTADTPRTDPSVACELRLRADGMDDLHVDVPSGDPVPVLLFSSSLTAVPASPEAHAWLQKVLGRDDLRLVWCHDPRARSLSPKYSQPGDHTAFADGYPITLASEASLRQLNDWMVETALELGEEPAPPIGLERFRPSIVVDGDQPFDEDHWSGVQIGGVRFRVAKPSDRCVVTTVDPRTLAKSREPLRTLARHRRAGSKTLFATNLIPENTGTLRLGDPVTVIRR